MATNQPPRDPIKSSALDKPLNSAIGKQESIHEPSEAKQHAKKTPGRAGDKSADKGNILKIVGGAVAVVAAVALGTHVAKQRKSKREEAEAETKGILDSAGRSLRGTQRWFGEKAGTAKDKAGDVADDVGPRIKGAASATKDKVNEVIPSSVSNTAVNIKDRAHVAGIKAEREGLKASEASDAAVRDAADKLLHTSGRAAEKVDAHSGGFFSGVRAWLVDRKDDAAEATGELAYNVKKTVKGKK